MLIVPMFVISSTKSGRSHECVSSQSTGDLPQSVHLRERIMRQSRDETEVIRGNICCDGEEWLSEPWNEMQLLEKTNDHAPWQGSR